MHLFPMNAQECKDQKKQDRFLADPDYVAETKWNGYRQLIRDGEAFSRSVSVKDGEQVSKSEYIPHVVHSFVEYKGYWFDGELLQFPKGKAKNVTSIMQSKTATDAIAKQAVQGKLTYMLFDILKTPDGEVINLPWKARRKLLEDAYWSGLYQNEFIRLSNVCIAGKTLFLQDILREGYEGIMLKNVNAPYKPSPPGGDSRPAGTWYKIKAELEHTEDVVILGFKPAEQYYRDSTGKVDLNRTTRFYDQGWIGGVLIGQYVDGEMFPVGSFSGIKDELRADMTANPNKYIGEVVELRAFEREPSGRFVSPVFIRLRDDKRPEECTWNKEV